LKTAEELGIKQWEYDGLIALIDYLPTLEMAKPWQPPENKTFDMFNYYDKSDCGTAACIGGWNYILTHADARKERVRSYVTRYGDSDKEGTPLGKLYYPGHCEIDDSGDYETPYDWRKITPDIAVEAIKNVLNMGDPQWATLNVSQ
jgi:hypothetical protein